jgi:hypothetical protein
MTPAIVVAAVVTLGLAFGSLIMQVDGAKLRRWRLSRRWDVSRLAREFIAAADEPLATVRGLTHMINAWERGDRRPSERYWLLYLRLFPECAKDVAINVTEAVVAQAEPAPESQDISALAATVTALEQRIAGLTERVDELSRGGRAERQPREAVLRRKARARYRRSTWLPLSLCAAFAP